MITASTSSRFTADATPAPSASSARSMSWSGELVVVLQRPLPDPLVSRSRPRSSMISNSFVFAPSS